MSEAKHHLGPAIDRGSCDLPEALKTKGMRFTGGPSHGSFSRGKNSTHLSVTSSLDILKRAIQFLCNELSNTSDFLDS